MNKTIKVVKLSDLHRPNKREPVPFLRLSGEWLRRHGFDCHAFVRVEAVDGRIVLEPVAVEEVEEVEV